MYGIIPLIDAKKVSINDDTVSIYVSENRVISCNIEY